MSDIVDVVLVEELLIKDPWSIRDDLVDPPSVLKEKHQVRITCPFVQDCHTIKILKLRR
jgi:hypothetical protein